jgi:hypothetical protein
MMDHNDNDGGRDGHVRLNTANIRCPQSFGSGSVERHLGILQRRGYVVGLERRICFRWQTQVYSWRFLIRL